MHARDDARKPASQGSKPRSGSAAAIGLQRVAGNAAVNQLLRTTHGKGKAKAPAKPVYKPASLTEEQENWTAGKLTSEGNSAFGNKNYKLAAALFEAAYWKKDANQKVLVTSLISCYGELAKSKEPGAQEMADHWKAVRSGDAKPVPPPELRHN